MTDQFYVHLILMFISITISLLLAVYSWLRRGKPGVTAFSMMMFIVALLPLTVGMRALTTTREAAAPWAAIWKTHSCRSFTTVVPWNANCSCKPAFAGRKALN